MNVYKIDDIISCEFLKIPKTMFANDAYRSLSSDAKLTYALLYDRLSLSKLNGWINDNDEVFLIYTREEISEDLGISYKKAIAAFRELLEVELIAEKRRGRGEANIIYIVKPEITEAQAKRYTQQENLRYAESAYQEDEIGTEICGNGTSCENPEIKNFPNGISGTAGMEHQDMPISHTNKTDNIKTNINHTENSQSVSCVKSHWYVPEECDRHTDDIYSLDDILENCCLDLFEEDERILLYDALERMYYTDGLKIGNAVLPLNRVRSRMYDIDHTVLQSALSNLHKNDREIKNITSYVISTIFNCIAESQSILHVDPYLNSIRKRE